MPEVRRYTVIQERRVQVRATSIVEAVKEADNIFANGPVYDGSNPNQVTEPEVTNMTAREEV